MRMGAHASSFYQNALNKKAKLLYVVFDALFVGGKDIRTELEENHTQSL
jgi:ATP-dependent DNA ligase